MRRFSGYVCSLILGAVLIISCKKDDGPPPVSNLVGTWTMVSLVTTGCTDPTDNVPLTNCTSCPVLVITQTTITTTFPGSSQPVTSNYTAGGNALVLTNQSAIPGTTNFTDTTTFLVIGTNLTLTIAGTTDNGNCRTEVTLKKT